MFSLCAELANKSGNARFSRTPLRACVHLSRFYHARFRIAGTWVTFGSQLNEEQAEEVVTLAYDSGINLFDLSEAYSGTRAEVELGRILQRKGWKRTSYVVTTKIYWNSK